MGDRFSRILGFSGMGKGLWAVKCCCEADFSCLFSMDLSGCKDYTLVSWRTRWVKDVHLSELLWRLDWLFGCACRLWAL